MKHDQAPARVRQCAADFLVEIRASRGEHGFNRRETYDAASTQADDMNWYAPLGRVDHQLLYQASQLLRFRIRDRPGTPVFQRMDKAWKV